MKKQQDRTLKQRAVAYLARREHSRAELAKKLSAHGTQEEIDSVLNSLQDAKLLSDQRFAAAFIRSRAERFGAGRLRQELRQRGVEDSLVEQELAVDDLPSEIERARMVWKKEIRCPARLMPGTGPNRRASFRGAASAAT